MMMKAAIIKELKERKLKLTPQRLAIIDALIENTLLHPGASLIYRVARKKAKSLSLSTVYATLDELSRQGIIKILEFDKMENRYDGNIAAHINLVCKGCQKIMDYKLPIAIDLREVAKKAHFWISDTRLEYYGYCQECRKK
jgi:Fe2+ or Zn2+ uptake regulation protein